MSEPDPSLGGDGRFMALALALGRRGLGNTWPNPAVGAVIVKDGAIVGRGWTQPGGRPHAEVEALRRAGQAVRGATLYVTLEPCSHFGKTPPCADAVIAAGISRVVSALPDPNPDVSGAGHARLRDAGIAVEVGVGADEAAHDHAGHIRRMRDGRPHVILKFALSADGKVAAAGRKPVAITGEATRAHVHLMRAQSDAIMIGIGTAIADDPLLTCRLPGMGDRSPVRIVLDSKLRLPLDSHLVRSARDVPLWLVGDRHSPQAFGDACRAQGGEVLWAEGRSGRIDLGAVLRLIAQRGVTRLMVEGGPTLAAGLLEADLVDEAHLFHSAAAIGADGIDAFDTAAAAAFTRRLKKVGSEPLADDRHEIYERR